MTDKLKHRKASRTARLTDASGKVLANTKIRLEQKNHEFLFGCGAFDYLAYAGGFGGDVAKDRVEKWLKVYNYGTVPIYWGTFEREEGEPATELFTKTADMMLEKGIKLKGHPLCWHTVCADWLLKYDNDTILEKQLARIRREVGNFKGKIDMWDVINEVVIMPEFDKYDNAVTRLCKEHGRVGLIKKVFAEARQTNPDATLLLNDFNTSQAYRDLIADCLDAGVSIDVIGIQSHQHQGYWGKEKIADVLERFGAFGLPIHFTENTILSGASVPPEITDLNDWQVDSWPSTPEYEQIQLEQTEEMYRTLFENPLVQGITGWDFADGAWLHAPAGVVREDNSEKPVYFMLKDLIHKEWHTDCELCTDENGFAELYGFKGEYTVSSGDISAEVTITDGAGQAELVLK